MYGVLRGTLRFLAATYLARRVHVEGLNLVPRSGGVLLVSNHIATIDPPLTGAMLPRLDVHYMAKSESFTGGMVNRLFAWYHAFPVNRGSADRASLRHALSLLNEGHVVLIYPEGSRSPDARMSRPHPGIGFVARHSSAVVLPAAIWGSEHVLPKGSNWPRRSHIWIRYGRPFRIPERDSVGRRIGNQEAADLMMWRVAELLPESYRGVFTSAEAVQRSSPPAA